jgi:hypothetical protein
MGMIPGFNADMFGMGAQGDRASQLQIKRYITIIESMTEKELDTTNLRMLQEPSRIERLARGSGARRRARACGGGWEGTAGGALANASKGPARSLPTLPSRARPHPAATRQAAAARRC